MEKRINNKARTFFQTFKDDIKDQIIEMKLLEKVDHADVSKLLQFIYDYQPILFEKVDFQKESELKT